MLQFEIFRPRLILASIGLTLFSLSSGGCAPDQEFAPASDPDLVSYNIKLPVQTEKLNANETSLVVAINRNEPVSFQKISQLLLESFEDKLDATSREQARERFAAILPANLRTQNPPEIKVDFERALGDYFNGQELSLNYQANNPLEILNTNQISPIAGTILYNLVARELGAVAYRQKNFVAIFTNGQVQPGWIEKNGDDLVLYGINMELDGLGGPEVYGSMRNLGNKIVIVDAEIVALLDLFRGRIKEGHECSVREQAIQWTAQRYKLSRPAAACGADKSFTKESLTRSLFLFGQIPTVQGVRARAAGGQEIDRSTAFRRQN